MQAHGFSTTISVPKRDLPALMDHLARAGFLVLDNGGRITTEEGMDAEANLEICWLGAGG